jgi:hypothetical protein
VAGAVSRRNLCIGDETGTYTFAIIVEEGLEFDDIGMSDDAHNLQLAVLGGSALVYAK